MDLEFTHEQKMLKDQARKFLAGEWSSEKARETAGSESGHDAELWKKMADLGWLGLLIPEAYDGMGMGILDLAVLMEECGRALVPSTLFSTLQAALVLLNGGGEGQKRAYLPRIASGGTLMSLAVAEPQAIHDPVFFQTRGGVERGQYVLNGTKLFVPNAATADELLVVARTGAEPASRAISLFLVHRDAPGLHVTPLVTFGGDKQSEVRLESVRVSPDGLLGRWGAGWPAVEKAMEQATVLLCAEMVGGAQQVLDLTVSYMNERHQFDRPIGSFQAVQHFCADMSIGLDGARELSYQAASLLNADLPARKEVSMAKAWTGEVYKRMTLVAHELFGGIGFSREHDLHLYSSRAKTAELTLGTRDRHLEIVAEQLGL